MYRDLKNVQDTAFDDGKAEEKIELATNFKNLGTPIDVIAKATGLSRDEIEKL